MNKLAIVILVICFNVFSQSVVDERYCGEYVFSSHAYHRIELYENGIFLYELRTSLKYPMFYGTWKVKNDKLFLRPFTSEKNKPRFLQNWCEYTSSDSIYIYVHDNNYRPIKCDSLKLWYGIDDVRWVLMDEENKCVVPKDYLNKTVDIVALGYESVTIKYKPNKGNCMHVFLPRDVREFPLKFTVMKIKDNLIIMPTGAILKRIE